jgi:hypothetical protein
MPKHECSGKFTARDLQEAVVKWASELRYFPADPPIRAEIMDSLRKMACCKIALVWIVHEVVGWREWLGFGAVRERFCQRYRPNDGNEPDDFPSGEMIGVCGAKEWKPLLLAGAPAKLENEAEIERIRRRIEEKLQAQRANVKARIFEARPPLDLGEPAQAQFEAELLLLKPDPARRKSEKEKAVEIAELEARLGIRKEHV